MRIRTIGILAAGAFAASACASSATEQASLNRPPSPVNLTVYVNDARVSVSPTSVGAGPVMLIVTNQASHVESLAISAAGSSQALASTAPINPQGTTQVQLDVTPGRYTIATAPRGHTDAQLSRPSSISAATIHIGRERSGANGQLMQP
jgi:hypothetical protein